MEIRKKIRSDKKYKPSMCATVIQVAKEGGFHPAMMLKLGISRTSFYTYIRDYPEFARAVEQADLITQAQHEKNLVECAEGSSKADFKATAFVLQTKFNKDYPKDTPETNNTTITVNNLNITPQERDNKIAQLADKLRAVGFDLSSLMNPTTTITQEISSDDHPDE